MIKFKNIFDLKNKKVFIFGGAGLIGSSLSEALNNFGSELIVFDSKKNHKLDTKIKYVNFDISDLDNLNKNLQSIINKFGCPDVFINCTYPKTNKWLQSSRKNIKLKTLRDNVDIHLNSYSWTAYFFCEQMRKNKIKGSIIQFSSIYGILAQNLELYKKTSITENLNYSIIKGGIVNFSRQLASVYGKYKIRVNSICPGGIEDKSISKKNLQSKIFINNYIKQCPLKKMATPEDIIGPTIFLASNASSYITGSTLMVDGGWSII